MLLVCSGTAIWLKMARPSLPLSCTGVVAWQIKADAKRIKLQVTKFLTISTEGSFVSVLGVHRIQMDIKKYSMEVDPLD